MISTIQPKNNTGDLYSIGCVGRITAFHETDDGRYLITLRGLRCFKLKDHHLTADHFYLAHIDWIEGDNLNTHCDILWRLLEMAATDDNALSIH
jgi:Lon protease-like protein